MASAEVTFARWPRSSTVEEIGVWRAAKEAWRQKGVALIDPDLIADPFARQAVINEANRLYGRRDGNGGERQS